MLRSFDYLISVIVIIIFFPILTPFVVIKILVDGFPLLYISERIGLNNKPFRVYKFRTMINDKNKIEEYIKTKHPNGGYEQLSVNAPIYSKLGRIFEIFQFVELPQFINIILGQMSIVGNRPLPKKINDNLISQFSFEKISSRMDSLPGITGIVQITGKNELSDSERLKLETLYCDYLKKNKVSKILRLNILIILETFIQIVLLKKLTVFKNLIIKEINN